MQQAGFVVPKFGLETLGLKNLGNVHWNLSVPALYEEAIRRGEGQVADGGALVVRTGVHTGRSPNDKFFVEDAESQGPHRLGQDQQADLARALSRALQPHAGLCPAPRPVRARLLGRRRSRAPHRRARHHRDRLAQPVRPQHVPAADAARSSQGFKPDFTILQPAGLPGRSRSSTAPRPTAPSWSTSRERVVLIGGTWYAGEIKKSIFTILNYLLPDKNVLPMHCSANVGPKGDVAIFFGLSRHRQDHAVGRSVAHPDRRRRARLGRDRRLQLRGRLLRQGDQALPRGRARDLRHHRALRHGAGERRDRSGDRPARPRRRPLHREHARLLSARVHPQRHRHRASPARRRTSSC